MTAPKLIGRECRHAIYVPSNMDPNNDAIFVKEYLHYDDGTIKPNVAFKANPKQDYYITKENFRNHNDKKITESLTRVQKFSSNPATMLNKIARQLGKRMKGNSLRRLARSPYLYGADISLPATIKHEYLKRWPSASSSSSVSVLDIETDVVAGHEQIISCTLSFKDRVYLGINSSFIKGMVDVETQVQEAFEKYLGKYKKERNINLIVEIFDTPGKVVKRAIEYAHDWAPDFVAVWNIDFDLPKILDAMEAERMDIAKIFSDPGVPPEYRYFSYTPGQKVKKTSSGKTQPLGFHERWHVALAPSKFYWIDAMVVYAMIRKAKGNEPSYALDAILNKVLGVRKLNFDVADKYSKLAWHVFMQTNYKIEYLIYNIFDCISVELLDEKTKDLSITLGELCGFSEYQHFNSTPKQLADDLHFFHLEEGKVIACISDQMEDELDALVIGRNGWICTLPTHLMEDNGLYVLEDFPKLRSMIRAHVAD